MTTSTKHIGDLTITKRNAASVAHITEVTGYLDISAEASLPVLTSVGGSLRIEVGVEFDHSSIVFGAGKILAIWEYALHMDADGLYAAGCRGPWTRAEAMKHWGAGHHAPSRAVAFREAIEASSVVTACPAPHTQPAPSNRGGLRFAPRRAA